MTSSSPANPDDQTPSSPPSNPNTAATQMEDDPPQQEEETKNPDPIPTPNPDSEPLQPQTYTVINPDEKGIPRSPKPLTLEISEDDPLNPQDDPNDPNQDDPEDPTPFSPTVSNIQVSIRRGTKRKKRNAAQEKKFQKKLESLAQTFKPIPFSPAKTLNFAAHEPLLKRLGLWDFVHLQFDSTLRRDLIMQLIVSFVPISRCSYVDGVRVGVNRADLARALKLPLQKKVAAAAGSTENAIETKGTKEEIAFVEELVGNWMMLQEDAWAMPQEVLNWIKLIKEGSFEKVDWAGMIWFMVEKELVAQELGNCYYASHLQLLIRYQREELLKEEPVVMEIDGKEGDEVDGKKVGEEENDEVVVRAGEEVGEGLQMEEQKIELSLGGMENLVKDDVAKEEKENVGGEDMMDFEGSKEEGEEHGQWRKASMDGHFLLSCNLGEAGVMEYEEDAKQEEEEEEEEVEDEEEKEGEQGEEVDEEHDDDEMGFALSPKGDALDGVGSENLIAAMEASQIPLSRGLEVHDNLSSGEFLATRADMQTCGTSLFGNVNGNQKEIGHLENDVPHHSFNGGNKRMRTDGSWQMKSTPSEFDGIMSHMQEMMGKARNLFVSKESAYQHLAVRNQELMLLLQQRENMMQQLQQKRDGEVFRLERELYMMGNLLEGYRKALKATDKAFAEYRSKCPQPEEPIYKDAGPGGLVLSVTELEKQRLKQEEEESENRVLCEKVVKEFEESWIVKFESYSGRLELFANKIMDVEKQHNLLKEMAAKPKVSEISESAPT